MDFFTLFGQGVLFVHTVAFAIALSAVLREDLALVRAGRIDLRRLVETTHTLTCALIALWATGLALVVFDVGFDARAFVASPKLAAKVFVVSALTANGLALHTLAFPILRGRGVPDSFGLSVPVVLGAISTVSWLYASFIGVSRWIAPVMSFTSFIAFYGVLLVAGITVALLFVRRRVERLLVAQRVTAGTARR